jgi:hypothetical protein
MKKGKIFLIIASAAIVLYGASRVYLMNCGCKVEPFETKLFTEEEIDEAIEISLNEAENAFEKRGCNILKVYYAGDERVSAGNNVSKPCIEVYTDFYAGFFVPAEINQNYIEKNWKYTLEKQETGEWIIVNRGRC